MRNKLFFRVKRLHTIAAVVMACASTVLLVGCSSPADTAAPKASAVPVNVTLTAAQQQSIQLYTVASVKFHKSIDTTGVVDYDHDQATSVLAPFSGPVSQLLVALGAKVKKGEALATVDSPDFAAAIGAYRKALAVAKTTRRLADMDQDLLQHHGIAQREVQQAQSDAIGAESDRDAARQALVALHVDAQTIADIEQGRPVAHVVGTIRAPISGTVVDKLITPGQLLQAGTTPCFTVADLSRVWVMAQVFDTDLAAVGIGDWAQVLTGADAKAITGKVTNVSAAVNPDTRAVSVRVSVENPGDLLKKQMYVRVLIQPREENTGLLIPVSALLRDDENLPFVYVVQPDGSYARRPVTLGYRDGERIEIAAGLAVGDKVVVAGGIFVRFIQSQ